MTTALFDQTVTIGADGTALIGDAASPHGYKFSTLVPGAGTVTSLTATAPIVITPSPTTTTGVISLAPTGALGVMTRLAQVVTAASQATVVFATIPNTYTNLKVIYSGRDTSNGVADSNMSLYFNADKTAANYSVTQNAGATLAGQLVTQVASSVNGGVIGQLTGTLNVATAFSSGEVTVPNYAGTTFFKSALGLSQSHYGTTTSQLTNNRSFSWLSTAAIATLTFTAGGTAFVDGSTFTLYGMP